MSLQVIHFTNLIEHYRNEAKKKDKKIRNIEIAKKLDISERTFYRYKAGEIPTDLMNGPKRKVIIRHRGLKSRKLIDSPSIITDYIVINRNKHRKITGRQILKRNKLIRKRLISKKIKIRESSNIYYLTVKCNCINISDERVTHNFTFNSESLLSDNKMLDRAEQRHSIFWSNHKLLKIDITSVIETSKLSENPFKSKSATLIRNIDFGREIV